MNEHGKKMIAPIVITILCIAYYFIYFGFLCAMVDGLLQLAFGVIPVALTILMIFVCKQRIEEIRSGEEDDLSKY